MGEPGFTCHKSGLGPGICSAIYILGRGYALDIGTTAARLLTFCPPRVHWESTLKINSENLASLQHKPSVDKGVWTLLRNIRKCQPPLALCENSYHPPIKWSRGAKGKENPSDRRSLLMTTLNLALHRHSPIHQSEVAIPSSTECDQECSCVDSFIDKIPRFFFVLWTYKQTPVCVCSGL